MGSGLGGAASTAPARVRTLKYALIEPRRSLPERSKQADDLSCLQAQATGLSQLQLRYAHTRTVRQPSCGLSLPRALCSDLAAYRDIDGPRDREVVWYRI